MDTGCYIAFNPRNFDRLWDIPTITTIDTNNETWVSAIASLNSLKNSVNYNPVIISTSAGAPEEEFDERWFDLLEE